MMPDEEKSFIEAGEQVIQKTQALQNIRNSIFLLTGEPTFIQAMGRIFFSIKDQVKRTTILEMLYAFDDEYFNKFLKTLSR